MRDRLDRPQTTVQDASFMSGMIPHHSLAITRSERAEHRDVRVCGLAVEIDEAQRRGIFAWDRLVDDIERNGVAATSPMTSSAQLPKPDRTYSYRVPANVWEPFAATRPRATLFDTTSSPFNGTLRILPR